MFGCRESDPLFIGAGYHAKRYHMTKEALKNAIVSS